MGPFGDKSNLVTKGSILLLTLIAAYFIYIALKAGIESPTQEYVKYKLKRESEAFSRRHLYLVDAGEAPYDLRHYAEQGFKLMVDTQTHAKDYVVAKLNCTNCHFAAGDTTGGSQGSISLAGVAAKYPAFDKRYNKVINLETRINSCFTRSMNGKPLPLDSEEMLSLVVYMHWISSDLGVYVPVPWLGLKYLSPGTGNAESGKKVYNTYCALCHKPDGQGGENNPPLWGEWSFNKEAGFNDPEKLSAFIYWNMPYATDTPALTEQQARDVTAYILSQPRP